MTERKNHKVVKPLVKRQRNKLDEIGKMGQSQRRFIAWLWGRHEEVRAACKPGGPRGVELGSKGFVFFREKFLGKGYTAQQSEEVSRWLKALEKRGMLMTFSRTGKHVTHIRLTELGKMAGHWYHVFGCRSPAELDVAVKYSSYFQRKELYQVKWALLNPDDPHTLWLLTWYRVDLATVAERLEAEIIERECRFFDGLFRRSPEQRAELIDSGRTLLDLTKWGAFMDGAPPPEYCEPLPVEHGRPLTRNPLSVN